MRSIESVVAAGLCHRGQVADRLQTATGVVVGSPALTAPEVLADASPTPASDMYSLGVTLFCALTGHAAFERRTGEQVVTQFLRITSQPIPDLRKQELAADRDHRTGLGKHRHRGTVTVVTTKGQWEYLEYDWAARPGVYVREKPGTIHTLHVFAPGTSLTMRFSPSSTATGSGPSSRGS